jgi:hypothetical protein
VRNADKPVVWYTAAPGVWWVELLPYYSATDLRMVAQVCGRPMPHAAAAAAVAFLLLLLLLLLLLCQMFGGSSC